LLAGRIYDRAPQQNAVPSDGVLLDNSELAIAGRRSFFLVALFALTVAVASAGAQGLPRTCLRFDRPYFVWTYRDSTGNYRRDSSSVVALGTSAARAPSGARRLEPLPGHGSDTWSKSLWSPSYWRAGGGDSVEIMWTTMLTGSHALLVGRDTLRGTVTEFSDVVPFDRAGRPVPGPAAHRIVVVKTICPR
jgi:hypothetical protein